MFALRNIDIGQAFSDSIQALPSILFGDLQRPTSVDGIQKLLTKQKLVFVIVTSTNWVTLFDIPKGLV